MNCYQEVTVLGNMGADSDIRLNYNNKFYYIQVKTLTLNKNGSYCVNMRSHYPDNMLIIMVDKERRHFAIDYAGNIKPAVLHLSFKECNVNSKYKNIMFTDINQFKNKIKELMVKSCTQIKFSGAIYKEFLMMQRLETFCVTNNINYIRNTTNGNVIDGNINKYRFQAKFVSTNQPTSCTYPVTFSRNYGRLNGQEICAAYNVGDFDFAIIEVGGTPTDEHKYENNFCIIPEKVLIDQNILRSDTCEGKKSFMICPPDYIHEHWSKKYWNNIHAELCFNIN